MDNRKCSVCGADLQKDKYALHSGIVVPIWVCPDEKNHDAIKVKQLEGKVKQLEGKIAELEKVHDKTSASNEMYEDNDTE